MFDCRTARGSGNVSGGDRNKTTAITHCGVSNLWGWRGVREGPLTLHSLSQCRGWRVIIADKKREGDKLQKPLIMLLGLFWEKKPANVCFFIKWVFRVETIIVSSLDYHQNFCKQTLNNNKIRILLNIILPAFLLLHNINLNV